MRRRWHPALWWAWAFLIVVIVFLTKTRPGNQPVAIQITSIIIALLIASRIRERSRIRIVRISLLIALSALIFRLAMAFLVGVPMPGRTLFTLPQIHLPSIFVGITIGGPVTTDRLIYAFREILIFIALVIVIGVANALSSPHRFLRVLPRRFYGFGLAITIANTFLPKMADSTKRVSMAMRMRGQPNSARRIAIPVLAEALERSVDLAAALESRGYGRNIRHTRYRPESWTRQENLALSGLLLLTLLLPLIKTVTPPLIALFAFFSFTPLLITSDPRIEGDNYQ